MLSFFHGINKQLEVFVFISDESIHNFILLCVHRHIFVKLNTFCKNHILFRNVLTARTCVSIANKNIFSLEILVLIICMEMNVLYLS